ncbi:hypothetical protein HOY80DRAFT_893518, partial [Tuber brumale]
TAYPPPMNASGGPRLLPITTCPPFDVLVIPGPDALVPLRDDVNDFIVARVEEVQAVLAVCSAPVVLAKAGCDGGEIGGAMNNKILLKAIGSHNAFGVHWVSKGRWMREGGIFGYVGGVMIRLVWI